MWYSSLKKLLKYDKKEEVLLVESIKHLSDEEQAERIAEKFPEVSNEYEPLNRNAIKVPVFEENKIPKILEDEVKSILENMKLNESERINDIPAQIFRRFSDILTKPTTKLMNICIHTGTWPDFWKLEIVSAVPKVSNPKNVDDPRKS